MRLDTVRRKRSIFVLIGGLVALVAVPSVPAGVIGQPLSVSSVWAHWNALRGDAYALDGIERFVEGGGAELECDETNLVSYSGTTLRYHGSVQVEPEFRERLQRFEEIVARTALEVYGRSPSRIRHYGAYSCRLSRNRSHRLSEHALGNAIDIVGFDFGPATKAQLLGANLPKTLRHAFRVRVAEHWEPRAREADRVHSRFLRALTARLEARRDVFRGLIGPSHPSHKDHFHFDVAPWRYVRL